MTCTCVREAGDNPYCPLHNLSAPSGSDMGEGTLAAFFAEREAYAELLRGKSNQHANGIFETLWKLREALRSTPSSTLTPDAEAVVARLNSFTTCGCGDDDWPLLRHDTVHLIDALSATPAIRNRAFEEAARLCDGAAECHQGHDDLLSRVAVENYESVAKAIRALKGTPPSTVENDDGC